MCLDHEKPSPDFPSGLWEYGDNQDYKLGANTAIFSPDVYKTIEAKIDELNAEFRELSLDIHTHPELGFDEHYAHDALVAFMARHGFEVTGHYKLDTAFMAKFTHGTGGRTLGINSEMDALPGIGHACGHNLIAMSGAAVACAVKAAIEEHNIPGTIILLGTPAEEGGGGKCILLEKGAYEGMDVCLMCHPGPGAPASAAVGSTLARQPIEVEFYGRPAHAAAAPWEGRNALDAAVSAYTSVAMLRQQLKPDHRVHTTINGRNWAVNIIPDYAKMEWLVRAPSATDVEAACERVEDCLRAAALATGTRAEIKRVGRPYKELSQNTALGDEFSAIWRSQFGSFQYLSEPSGASTDFGNVCFEIPSLHPFFSIPTLPGGVNHTPAFTEASRAEHAHKAALNTSKALAAVGARVLADNDFYQKVQDAFQKRKNAKQ